MTPLLDRFEVHIAAFWEPSSETDVFVPSFVLPSSLPHIADSGDDRTDDDGTRTQAISQALSRTQPLAGLYAPLLKQILDISKSTTVSFRTKSIRAISLIVAHDPDLFHDVSLPSIVDLSGTDEVFCRLV